MGDVGQDQGHVGWQWRRQQDSGIALVTGSGRLRQLQVPLPDRPLTGGCVLGSLQWEPPGKGSLV